MKRVFLFLMTNLAVIVVISVVTHLLGVDRYLTRRGLNYELLLGFSVIVGFSGSFISLLISKWMAKMAYGIQIIERPSSQAEQWLKDKIAEQSKKAGVKMPEVGVYESDEVNAFATGPSRNNSLVAVSSGLIRRMNLREIEGVLAHEVSHIANGDMVTMSLLQGVLNTFVVFFSRVIGFALDSFLHKDERENRGPGMGYFLGYIVCEILLGVLASIVVMAYSRRREFAADAMAAKLESRDSMVAALRRLQSISEGGGIIDDRSPALSAFKISGKRSTFAALFSTHPPLEDRIAALENAR